MLALHTMRVARALLLRENRARCLRRSYQIVALSGVLDMAARRSVRMLCLRLLKLQRPA